MMDALIRLVDSLERGRLGQWWMPRGVVMHPRPY